MPQPPPSSWAHQTSHGRGRRFPPSHRPALHRRLLLQLDGASPFLHRGCTGWCLDGPWASTTAHSPIVTLQYLQISQPPLRHSQGPFEWEAFRSVCLLKGAGSLDSFEGTTVLITNSILWSHIPNIANQFPKNRGT